jgi:serine/threonine protein kinase
MFELEETVLGHYQIKRRLKRGGMSVVYLAHDEHTQQDVAIKLVHSHYSEYLERLQREANMLSRLTHASILPVLAYGTEGPWYYLVTPYMEHGTLSQRLKQGPLFLEEAGHILTQIAAALQFAHDRGILHRDIKAANILFGGAQHVYLADFGLAIMDGKGSDLTQTGCLIGTPDYMAPELSHKAASTSSDIYALGILIYQMVTGQLPFKADTPLAVYWKQIEEQPVPPSQLNPAIPRAIDQVILRALAKNPQQRFQTAQALADAYTQALEAGRQADMMHAQTGIISKARHSTLNARTLPAVVRQSRSPGLRPRQKIQRGMAIACALLFLLIGPSTLGFVLSQEATPVHPLLGANAQLANSDKLHQWLGHSPLTSAAGDAGKTVAPGQHSPPTRTENIVTENTLKKERENAHEHQHEHQHGNDDHDDGHDGQE